MPGHIFLVLLYQGAAGKEEPQTIFAGSSGNFSKGSTEQTPNSAALAQQANNVKMAFLQYEINVSACIRHIQGGGVESVKGNCSKPIVLRFKD